MALGQSPPTTSGLVVVSGSDFFDPQTSDFPIVTGGLEAFEKKERGLAIGAVVFDDFFDSVAGGGFATFFDKRAASILFDGAVLDIDEDVEIRSTPVTTSGVVIMDMFIGAGVVFVVPVVGNTRLFPIFEGVFPEQDRRVFPRLPQSSTLTPGD